MEQNITMLETAQALQRDWALQLPKVLSEDVIIRLLADRLVQIIQKGPEAFFQLMYRLDIPEKRLNAAIGDADAAASIARLVYNRQLQKIESRRVHKTEVKDDEDADLRW